MMSENGWMNEKLTHEWLRTTWGELAFGRRLIVWDSYKCHIQDSTKQLASRLNTDMAVIPGGCTSLIQAPDVSWNKPFKDRYRELYEEWMRGTEKEYTRGGNVKAPFSGHMGETSLGTSIHIKSFKTCAITNNIDNSENEMIKVTRKDEVLFSSRDELFQKLKELTDSSSSDNPIENTHEIDSQQDEDNELIVLDDEA